MTNMIEALKQALVLAEALTPEPGDEPNPLDILATYAKGAIAEYEARLVAVEGELAGVYAMLDESLEEFADCIPYSQPYFDERWGYTETLNRLKEQRQNSGQRGRELAALLAAVGPVAEWIIGVQKGSRLPLPVSAGAFVDAYRVAYPEAGA